MSSKPHNLAQDAFRGYSGVEHPCQKQQEPSSGGFLFTVVRSRRRTMAIEIGRDRQVTVRVPNRVSNREVARFVEEYRERVQKKLDALGDAPPEPNEAQVRRLKERAKQVLPPLVDKWAKAVGVTPQGFSVTGARTRFGSCSSKGRLCFSYHLMRYPEEAIDYVVLHEVCHLRHMNHGRHFYALLSQHMPDYNVRRQLLKRPPKEEP